MLDFRVDFRVAQECCGLTFCRRAHIIFLRRLPVARIYSFAMFVQVKPVVEVDAQEAEVVIFRSMEVIEAVFVTQEHASLSCPKCRLGWIENKIPPPHL